MREKVFCETETDGDCADLPLTRTGSCASGAALLGSGLSITDVAERTGLVTSAIHTEAARNLTPDTDATANGERFTGLGGPSRLITHCGSGHHRRRSQAERRCRFSP